MDFDMGDGSFEAALLTEVAKRSGLCWVSYGDPPRAHPVWHVLVEGHICVVANGEEQPLPDIGTYDLVEITLRTKTDRHRVLSFEARPDQLATDSPGWEPVVGALVAGRLNLVDPANAPARWAERSMVIRFVALRITASPGDLPSDSLAATPLDTPATTAHTIPHTQRRRLS